MIKKLFRNCYDVEKKTVFSKTEFEPENCEKKPNIKKILKKLNRIISKLYIIYSICRVKIIFQKKKNIHNY